jgi:hypothetical protein
VTGNNRIHLNEATLIIAVQHYFDTVLFKDEQSPLVQSVRGCDNGFDIAVTDRPAERKEER